MHIIIGIITAVAGLIWALNSLQNSGVNLNSFNPYFWFRRRKWEKQLGTKPIHRLERPVEAAAVLMLAVAKLEGDITRELKAEIISHFESEFEYGKNEALELYAASSYMLQDEANILGEVENVLAPALASFQPHHCDTLLKILAMIGTAEGGVSFRQSEFIDEVEKQLGRSIEDSSNW